MRKNYTILVVLETPRGRHVEHAYTYKYSSRHDAIADVEQKLTEFRNCGYVHAYIGRIDEWTEVWW